MIGSEFLDPLTDREEAGKQAKIAMGLAVAVHLGTFLIGIFSPYLLDRRPLMPEIYTVNLVAVSEPAGSPAPRPQAVKKVEAPTPPEAKPAEMQAVETRPAESAATAAAPEPAAISTRPIRQKSSQDLKAIESIRRQFQAEQQAKKAEKDAQKAVSNALSAIRQSLHNEPRPVIDVTAKSSQGTSPGTAAVAGASSGVIVAAAKQQYFAAVYAKIKEHFILPDLKNWKPDLQAVLVIEVRKDGIVTKNSFEQKSGNVFFNQAVERALTAASPLPPFPPELKESQLEFGLRFRPGDLL